MNLEVVRTEDLDESRRTEIIAVCEDARSEPGLFRELFATYIPSGGRHILVSTGGVLISHAVVTERWAQPEGMAPLRTAYVDAVSTLLSHQGRGFGAAAMRGLAASIDDFQIGCLETEKQGFYARLGWEEWRGPLSGRHHDGTVVGTPDQRGVMVLRLPSTPLLDLDGGLSVEVTQHRIW